MFTLCTSQFGGTDIIRCYSAGSCYTINLTRPGWLFAPSCTYVDNFGPYLTWDASVVVLPLQRVLYFFGGRQTGADSNCYMQFVPTDEHWMLDLDTLVWNKLSGSSDFWGLPQITGLQREGMLFFALYRC